MQQYKLIEIFSDEESRWRGEPLAMAIVQMVHDLKIAARCLVTRGTAGSYESGEIATGSLEVLSYNLPVRVTIILPAAESEFVLQNLGAMVEHGIVAVQDVQVLWHKTRGLLLPKHTRVRDMMTAAPQTVRVDAELAAVARLLLAASFTGLPVVDAENRPVGVITHSDLIYKAGLPIPLDRLADLNQERTERILATLGTRQLQEVMTQPAVTISQDRLATEAVQLMLNKQVHRLPVVDEMGKLVGNLSRVDVFHASVRECPDWGIFQQHAITVGNLRLVSDIMRREVKTVLPETALAALIQEMDCQDSQPIGVVDQEGAFLGLISDRELLAAFADRHASFWDFLLSKLPFSDWRGQAEHWHIRPESATAGEIMQTDCVTVPETAPIQEAIRLMLDHGLKHLPVLNSEGRLTGLVSRADLLRAGFSSPAS